MLNANSVMKFIHIFFISIAFSSFFGFSTKQIYTKVFIVKYNAYNFYLRPKSKSKTRNVKSDTSTVWYISTGIHRKVIVIY